MFGDYSIGDLGSIFVMQGFAGLILFSVYVLMALGLAALGLYRVYPWRGGLRRRRGARSPHEQPQDYHSLTTTHCSRVLQCLISARHLAWQRGHITYSVNFRDLLVAPGDATLEHCCWNIRRYKVVLNLHNVASTQIIRDGLP